MNVLIISPGTKGTIPQLSYNLYKAFTSSGHRVSLLCLSGDSSELPHFVEAMVLSNSNFKYMASVRSALIKLRLLRKVVSENKIDLSISTLLGCNLWNVLSLTKRDVKFGIFHTDPNQSKYWGIFKQVLFSWAYSYILPRLDGIIAVNKKTQIAIKTQYHVDSDLVYNVHDFSRIQRLSKEDIIEESDIFSKPTFLFIGHLTPVKGPERLIKAFSRIPNPKKYSLCFIGEGYMMNDLVNLAEEYKVSDSVHFLGYKSNPYKYLAKSQCLVLPSQDEGLPGVLIESLFLGVRVVSTNSSVGVWEILQCDNEYQNLLNEVYSNEFGSIVPNYLGSPLEEEKTINFLTSSMILEINKSDNLLDSSFNIHRFSAEAVINQYVKIYNRVVGRKYRH